MPVATLAAAGGQGIKGMGRRSVATRGVTIAQAKAESAVRFKRPTKVFEDALAAGGIGLRLLATHGACPLEGGLPLMMAGQLVGAIGVSGMQSTQDAQVAAIGAAAIADAG